jgi:hypothetical protein
METGHRSAHGTAADERLVANAIAPQQSAAKIKAIVPAADDT